MAEKLTVCDALDERDYLSKKIINAIDGTTFVAGKRVKDVNVMKGVPVEQFKKTAESSYQSIMALIDRYQRIDVAITEANASTVIETRSGRKMTRAAAIALRKALKGATRLDFEGRLLDAMTEQYEAAVRSVEMFNRKADSELEGYKMGLVSKDTNKKLSDDEVKLAEKMVEPLYGEMVDPLDIDKKIAKLRDEHTNLIKELESAIKVSNATTFIEI